MHKMDISQYTSCFHDGEVIGIDHKENNINFFIRQKDRDGKATGIRKDGKGHPPSQVHQDPRSQNPHGHVPGVTNPDGTPWLPIH